MRGRHPPFDEVRGVLLATLLRTCSNSFWSAHPKPVLNLPLYVAQEMGRLAVQREEWDHKPYAALRAQLLQ